MISRRKTIFGALFGAVAMTLSFTMPSFADVVVKHASGETTITNTPKKVVVFDLATLDNLQRLKAQDAVIGLPETPLPKYLSAYADAKYTKVGSLFEPNYETIAGLQPDLIIIAGRSQKKYADLTKLAPTIDLTVSTENYLADVDRNVTILGEIFGKQGEAKAEIAKLNETLAAAKKAAANKGKGLLILTTGGKMSVFGPGSRFGLLYSGYGVEAADTEVTKSKHGKSISFEFISEINPDWLFVIDRDAAIGREGQSAAQFLNNDLVNGTNAAKNKHIVYLDPQNWYLVGGGLSGLHETADQLIGAFANTQ